MKHVVSFYRFTELRELTELQSSLQCGLKDLGVVGTVLLAEEGVNATIAHVHKDSVRQAVELVESTLGIDGLDVKCSTANDDNPVFHRLKVKVRQEIVNFGFAFSSDLPVGKHVNHETWDALLEDPDVVVVDVRNDYEIAIGSFEGAQDMCLGSFRDLPEAAGAIKTQEQPVAMFCTGGIRCEKASQWLIQSGVEEVYQLDGGILGYLEAKNGQPSRWHGECFVFDQRVSVDAELKQGSFDQCHACRHPIDADDKSSPLYELSVSCPHCHASTTDKQKSQFAERARQEKLAIARGTRHVGLSN